MLYGNLIFIKKTGGDGSKFPVTERDVKIGRSEDCLIRIYNTGVAPEHCQLIVEENGQTTLRNLSNKTVLNGKPLGQGDVALCHGDIFKVGERLARWEYLPTSKFFRQLLSPTGRLVAVVMPQKRSMGKQANPGTSALKVSVLKNTPIQKRYSERDSSVKVRKSSGTDLICKTKGDLPKFLIGRHSLKTTRLLLSGAKVKDRKSTSGTLSSKITKRKYVEKSRISTLPSWKVNIVSPSQQKSRNSNSLTKSNKKSAKSPKSAVKKHLKDTLDSEFSQKLSLPVSKSVLKTPQSNMDLEPYGGLAKSGSKSISKTRLRAMVGSPSLKGERSVKSSGSFIKSPSARKTSPKSLSKTVLSTPKPKPPKFARLVHSESKLNYAVGRRDLFPDRRKGMNSILEQVDSIPARSFKKLHKSVMQEKARLSECIVSDGVMENSAKRILLNEATPVKGKQTHVSVKNTSAKKTSGKAGRPSREILLPKSPAEVSVKTPRKSVIKKTPGSLKRGSFRVSRAEEVVPKSTLPNDVNFAPSSNNAKHTPRKSAKSTSIKKTGKLVGSAGRMELPTATGREISIDQNETISLESPLGISVQDSGVKEASVKKMASSSKVSKSSPRGVRRKLSPSSSAERAAKKLKISSPKKPDKNKKAALLVLGKANRKQLPSQNVKVLLKQKIVKKAIKQSTILTSQKVESRTKFAAKLKKGLQKTALKSKKTPAGKEKSLDKISSSRSSKASNSSTIHCPAKEKAQEITPEENALLETSELSAFKAQTSPILSSKSKPIETLEKLATKHSKKSESPRLMPSSKSSDSTSSPSDKFYETAESFLFNSNRRSKRLSSKNETGRPDFIELSPTALGLIPKNVNVFKTPKDSKRRSSSLVTPKSIQSTGIIKSASTSRIGNRRSVRFSSKGVPYNSEFQRLVVVEKVDLDFSSYHSPDLTVDIFVSPLGDKSVTNKDVSEPLSTSATGDVSKTSAPRVCRSSSGSHTCVSKLLQSPQAKSSPLSKSLSQRSTTAAIKSALPCKRGRKLKSVRQYKSPKNDLSDLEGVPQLFGTSKTQKSPKNDLTDVKGIKKLFQTPKTRRSPKNDLTDVKGIKKLFQTPNTQKSPKNDLTDVRGVKKLMQSPKAQKSPKNDLTNVYGVKELLRSPRVQRSPKNDLSDLRGVRKLFGSPNIQRSPKNDLTDLTGVKRLVTTPRDQKSPKNYLLEISGLGNIFDSPAVQKISNNATVEFMKVPVNSCKSEGNHIQSSTDVSLIGLISNSSESVSKSNKTVSRKPHVNDYKAIRGRRTIYSTPTGPKNDLSDLTGVRELFSRHKPTSECNVNLTGVAELFVMPGNDVDSKPKKGKFKGKSMQYTMKRKPPSKRPLQCENELESEIEKNMPMTRGRILREGTEGESTKRVTRRKTTENIKEEKAAKRKAVKKSETKKTPAKRSEKVTKKETKTKGKKSLARTEIGSSEWVKEEVKCSRKRKVLFEEDETPPVKSKRKLIAAEAASSVETSIKTLSRSKKERVSEEKVSVKGIKRDLAKAEDTKTPTTSSKAVKTNTKRVQKVQNTSQNSSEINSFHSEARLSPRKTRSNRSRMSKSNEKNVSKTELRTVKKNVAKVTAGRSDKSPGVKRSTRRKCI